MVVNSERITGGLEQEKQWSSKDVAVPQDIRGVVQREMERVPSRAIIDFLVQFYVVEVNCTNRLVHPPSFLATYET